jgi:hypothetical protein
LGRNCEREEKKTESVCVKEERVRKRRGKSEREKVSKR